MDSVMSTAVYLAANAIHVYAVYLFMNRFLAPAKWTGLVQTLCYAVYFVLGSLSWLVFQNSTLNVILNLSAPLLIALSYRVTWKRRVFAAVFSCAVRMFVDWACSASLGESAIVTTSFLQSMILLVGAGLFHFFYRSNIPAVSRSPYLWLLILCSLSTIVIGLLLLGENSPHASVIAVILLLMNFFNFYLYKKEREFQEEKYQRRMLENVQRGYLHTIRRLEAEQKKVSFARHDMAKHFHILRIYAENGQTDEINAYLNEMEKNTAEEEVFAHTENEEADSLLNYELTRAKQLGAQILSHISLPPHLGVSAVDMTILLGNLLDNDVCALETADPKILKVDIRYMKGLVRIEIENTYNDRAAKKEGEESHGLGLRIVEETVQKYHGTLTCRQENGTYYAKALFYAEEPILSGKKDAS